MKNIKLILLGNSDTLSKIGHYPDTAKDNWLREGTSIFEKYCKSNVKKYEQRNRVVGAEGNYYFTISTNNRFYLVLASTDYAERQIFDLIDEIERENIHLLVDDKGQLNKLGKNNLKTLVETYQNPADSNKIEMVNNDINDIKIEMKENVKKVLQNVESVQVLEDRSNKIKSGSEAFKNDSNKLKKLTWCQNFKWTMILILLIIAVLLVIILPIALSGSSSSSNDKDNKNNNKTRILSEHEFDLFQY
jgi:hypothetical protein